VILPGHCYCKWQYTTPAYNYQIF